MSVVGCHKLTCIGDINLKKSSVDYIEGDKIGRFQLILTSVQEIVLEQDERHFSLRVSLVKKRGLESDDLVLAGGVPDTLFMVSGRAKTQLGRYYLRVAQPFLMWFLRCSSRSVFSR
jgi:Protein of unknown function (DUF2867).